MISRKLVKQLNSLPDPPDPTTTPNTTTPTSPERTHTRIRPVVPSIPTIHCPNCGELIQRQLVKLYTVELINLGKLLASRVRKITKAAKRIQAEKI